VTPIPDEKAKGSFFALIPLSSGGRVEKARTLFFFFPLLKGAFPRRFFVSGISAEVPLFCCIFSGLFPEGHLVSLPATLGVLFFHFDLSSDLGARTLTVFCKTGTSFFFFPTSGSTSYLSASKSFPWRFLVRR